MMVIERDSLLSLEQYARERAAFRARVIAHKKHRSLALGSNVTLMFEDELTIRYQIQEMLRIERTFEEAGIQDELDAYNPLVPDGQNWKATMLIEFPDESERKVWLSRLIGIEDRVWVQVAGFERVFAIADEDLERENAEKTSSVHFLRFELGFDRVAALRRGASVAAGIEHPAYTVTVDVVPEALRQSLCGDLRT
ncbi:MAG TPA: DUF3501 domain-containing protein [Thauera sp.]|nr:DUF3501 domain-containing protein [Thauera sp.]HHW63993.1 DUF3501 family protein [Rhodocyclaceae bacterium]